MCWLRGRASPASSAVVISTLHLQMPSSQRVCLQASCPKSVQSKLSMLHRVVHKCGRRHGENEPRSVGTHLGAHGMTVLLQVASSQPNSSAQSFTASFRRWPFGLPMTLSAPRHGDFPRSMLGSKLPVCWLRGRASPASFAVVISTLHLQMPSSQRVCLQASCPKSVQSKLSMLHRVVHECGRRHGENEPRSVGTHLGAHGMTVLLQVASSQPNSSAQSFTASFRRWPFGLPMTLSAPRHGDFPRSMLGSKLPVCWLRGRASPASSAVVITADVANRSRAANAVASLASRLNRALAYAAVYVAWRTASCHMPRTSAIYVLLNLPALTSADTRLRVAKSMRTAAMIARKRCMCNCQAPYVSACKQALDSS